MIGPSGFQEMHQQREPLLCRQVTHVLGLDLAPDQVGYLDVLRGWKRQDSVPKGPEKRLMRLRFTNLPRDIIFLYG